MCYYYKGLVIFFYRTFSKSMTSSVVLLSKFPVGSSARIILGFADKARAIATLCC